MSENDYQLVSNEVPDIVRLVWQLDSQLQPFQNCPAGALFTLHRLAALPGMLSALPRDQLDEVCTAAQAAPDSLAALPFELPEDGEDFLSHLSRITWSPDIEGAALVYETTQILTLEQLEAAPEDPQTRHDYLLQHTKDNEIARFVVAATRTETWSLVHPHFTTNPELIEQGRVMAQDLLELLTRNAN